jgi:Fe-Mn family superoxide dismutase
MSDARPRDMNRFTLPTVSFSKTGIPSFLSTETMEYHYGKHHKGYIEKLNSLLSDSDLKDKSLEEIVARASGPLFNNAAQAWNHTFYWNCLSPDAKKPKQDGEFLECLCDHFDSLENFESEFSKCATRLFGSGWTWLTLTDNGEMEIINSQNAANPIREGKIPLLVCDVWEHAYYIDYRNAREKYLKKFFSAVNWSFAEKLYSERDISFIGEWMELDEALRSA